MNYNIKIIMIAVILIMGISYSNQAKCQEDSILGVNIKKLSQLNTEETKYIKYLVIHLNYDTISSAQIEKIINANLNKFPDLYFLRLSNLGLEIIPDSVYYKTGLKIIDLSNNKIENIYNETYNIYLSDVEYLLLSNNPIDYSNIENFKNLNNIHVLYLDTTSCDKIPQAIYSMSKMEHLSLVNNNIKSFEVDLLLFKNIKTIDLSNNKIELLPSFTEKDRSLYPGKITLIDLSHNKLKEISGTWNLLFGINAISDVFGISMINFSYNNISKLDASILHNCNFVDLSYNKIVEIDMCKYDKGWAIGSLKYYYSSLTVFNLENNPIENNHEKLLTYSKVSNFNISIEQFINNAISKYEKKIEIEELDNEKNEISNNIISLTDNVNVLKSKTLTIKNDLLKKEIEIGELEEQKEKLKLDIENYYNKTIIGLLIFIALVLILLLFLYLLFYNKKIQKKKHLAEIKAKEAEKEALEKTYELEKLKITETAVAGLMHDMRQSTSLIRGCSSKIQQWLGDETKTLKDDKVQYQANKIEEAIRKIVSLTNNYMIIQTDRVQNESKEILLNEYIQLILTNYNSVLKKHQVKISIISDEDIRIKLPPGFIVEIFENLINNSIEHGFSNEKGINNQIIVKLNRIEDNVKIEFENNGKKIDNRIISDIFDPYFSTKETGGFHGIGLSKVKNLVENGLEGAITVDNIEEGVRFSIKLPYNQDNNGK